MKNEALKFLKKICKNRVKVTKRMVIFFLMTGGLLSSQVNFSEEVDGTKTATIKDLKDYDYPNSLHFVSVQYSEDDVKEYKDYYKYLDLLKKRLEYLKEIELEKLNGNSREKIKKIKEEEKKVKNQMEKLKATNKLISQKVTKEIESNLKKPKNSDKDKKIEEINNEYRERIDKINKLGTNFNNLGIDFAHSIAIGKGAEISGENGIAIGVDTLSGKDSISLGKATNASGEGNIAIGRDATLFSKTFKEKIGQQIARILNDPNTIVKFENEGDVEYKKTIVIGDGTKSSGNSNIAIGDNAVAMKKRLTLISLQSGGTLSDKNGAEIDARNWNDIAKQFYNLGNEDKRSYTFEVKPVENAIALGKNASAFADNVIAIGKGAISGFESAVSIGENADTEGKNSVAIGKNSIIFGESSVAIGEGSRTGKIKYVLKTIEGKDTVEKTEEFDTIEAAKQELEKKKDDLSKIYRIEVGGEKSEYSVAIGKDSAVEHSGSVAIGADSLAVKSDGDGAFTGAKHTSGETVSFGNGSKKRRLTNIADGKDSSDAVTVAQLQKAIADNKGGSGGSAVDSTLKLSNGKETKDLSLKDDTLELVDGTNTTVSLSKDDANKKATFKVDVKGDLTGITSISGGNEDNANKNSKIALTNKELTLTNKGKSVKISTKGTEGNEETRIEFDRPVKNKTSGGKLDPNPPKEDYGIGTINYLKDRRASKDNDYGIKTNIGRAATEGAVKEVDSKINVVYTDKDGNKLVGLVKANDNKYYKAEYVENNGELKEEYKNEVGKESKDIFATLLNPDGTTNNLTTKLRVADGSIAADSKDAINGGQLNTALEKKLDKEDLDIQGDNTYIQVEGNQNSKKNNYKISLKTDKLKEYINSNVDLSSKADKNAGNIEVSSWATKLGTGEVAENNTNLVTGGKVYNAIKNSKTKVQSEGDIITVTPSSGTDTGINGVTYKIGINDTKLSEKINASKVSVKEGEGIKVTSTGNEYKVALAEGLKTKIDGALQSNEADGKYAKLDASNITEANWVTKLGDADIENGTKLAKSSAVKTYVNNEINNITTTVSGKLSSADVDVKGDDYISVASDNAKTNHYTLTFDKDKLAGDLDLTKNAKLNEQFNKYALLDGSNLGNTEFNLTTWQSKLGTGEIANGNAGLVTGSTIYNYMTTFKQQLSSESTKDLAKKLNANADNLSEAGKTSLTNKLGTGEVAEGDTKLVTGGKVYTKLNEIKTDLDNKYKGLNTQVTTNTNDIKTLKTDVEDLKKTKQDITDINTKLDGKLDKSDLSITGDNYITADKGDKFNYTLKVNKTKLESDLDLTNNTSVNNMFTNKLGNINTNIGDLKNEVENNKGSINKLTTKVDNNTNNITNLKQDMGNKLNADANNLSADGITNLTNKLSKDSNIAKPKDRLVTDKQVNKYLSRYNDALGVVDKKSTVALEKSELALGGVANAVAMANLVQVNSYSRHRHNLSAAYGYYGGSHALAVGFSGTNEERNFVYKLSGSVNNKGNLAFGVGAGVMLGDKDERLTTEYSTKLKSVEKDLVEANKKIKEYEERQKATDIKVKELERKLNQILNKH